MKVTRNNQIFRNRRELLKLGLGDIMCDGIQSFVSGLDEQFLTIDEKVPTLVLDLLKQWESKNCTISKYDEIVQTIKKEIDNGQFINQFHRAWQRKLIPIKSFFFVSCRNSLFTVN